MLSMVLLPPLEMGITWSGVSGFDSRQHKQTLPYFSHSASHSAPVNSPALNSRARRFDLNCLRFSGWLSRYFWFLLFLLSLVSGSCACSLARWFSKSLLRISHARLSSALRSLLFIRHSLVCCWYLSLCRCCVAR